MADLDTGARFTPEDAWLRPAPPLSFQIGARPGDRPRARG
jgi:hypothetical protein